MPTLGAPIFLLLLLPAALAGWRILRRARSVAVLYSALPRAVQASRGTTFRMLLAQTLPALFLIGLCFCIVAMARPRTVLAELHSPAEVIAIQMVVDVSGSMEALDLSDIAGNRIIKERTRLDAVKETFARFIEKREADLIGLITFGGFASTRAPLTADHNALLHVLSGIEIPKPSTDLNGNIVDNEELLTAIGDGLATACARLDKVDVKSRIVVLLSDGESNTGVLSPQQAADIAKKMGIKVYTIGVGSNGEAPFKARNMLGGVGYVMGRVTLDEAALRKMAEETGGLYFNCRDPEGLDAALKEINKLEKTEVERSVYYECRELYTYFLIPGMLLVLVAAGLNILLMRRVL